MMLDPQCRALLDKAAAANLPGPEQSSAEEARELYKRSRLPLQPPKPEMGAVHDILIDGSRGPLRLREFRPKGLHERRDLPALVYFHGGGWLIGDIDTHDTLCRQLSDGSGAAVYSVNYAKAPEHQFPAAVEDALLATRYVVSSHAELGIDPARIGTGGDSAGGNLATVVAQALRGAACSWATASEAGEAVLVEDAVCGICIGQLGAAADLLRYAAGGALANGEVVLERHHLAVEVIPQNQVRMVATQDLGGLALLAGDVAGQTGHAIAEG